MITLNDNLFSGDTVLKILLQYSNDLKEEAIKNHNPIDMAHSNFLIQIIEYPISVPTPSSCLHNGWQ